MNNDRAIAIVGALANGVDPLTGTLMTAEHFLNDADVVRALYYALRALDKLEPQPTGAEPR